MSKDPINKIFGDDEDISQEMIIRYYEGKLSPKDMNRVERYLEEDEFAGEAMEGLSMMKKEELSPAIVEINRKIYEKAKSRRPKLLELHPSVKYAIAATFLLLLGVAFFFNFFLKNLEDKGVAENKAAEKNTEAAPVPEASISQDQVNVATKQEPKKQQPAEEETGKSAQLKESYREQVSTGDVVTAEEGPAPVQKNEKAVLEEMDESKKSIDANLSMGKAQPAKAADKDRKGEAIADDREDATAERAAVTKSDQANYKAKKKAEEKSNRNEVAASAPASQASGAAETETVSRGNVAESEERAAARTKLAMCLEVLKKDAGNDEALFYAGMSSHTLKEYKKAIEYYDKVLVRKQSPYYEDALYQKSLTLLALNKKKEAKKLLQQVVALKGRKQAAASDKLEELK